jgi:Dimerisation domain
MTFSAMAAKVLYAAAEMRIPDLLATGGQTTEQLARQTRAQLPSLRRLLRALTALDLLIQTGPDTLTAITEELPPHRYRVIEGTPEAGDDPSRP